MEEVASEHLGVEKLSDYPVVEVEGASDYSALEQTVPSQDTANGNSPPRRYSLHVLIMAYRSW